MKVTKEVTFDSAHMLSDYQGLCNNLHGHTYKLQVTLEGDVEKTSGMLVDFNELKQYLETVTTIFDHVIIFSDTEYRNEAEEALLRWADAYSKNYVVISNGKSTSECISEYIKKQVEDMLEISGLKVSVRLWETPTSFCEA